MSPVDPSSYFAQPLFRWLRLTLTLQAVGVVVLAGGWIYGGSAALGTPWVNSIAGLAGDRPLVIALAFQAIAIALGLLIAKRASHGQLLQAKALAQERADRRALFNASIDGIFVLDQAGDVLEANDSFAQMLGYSPEEMTALNVIDFDADLALVDNKTTIKNYEPGLNRLDRYHRRQDGSTYAAEISVSVVDWGGQAAHLCVCRDVSDRKQADLALLEAQQIAHIGTWEFDLASQTITWSAELFRIFGRDPAQGEPTYAEYLALLHPEDAVLLQRAVEQAIAAGTPYCIDYRALLPDGSFRYHEGRCRVERDGTGRVLRLFGTDLDITERQRAEQTIRQQAKRETLLREISQRIRQSLDLQTIFDTACREIRACLQADRVGIFKFLPGSGHNSGELVAESVVNGFPSAIASSIHDHCFGETHAALYAEGHYYVVDDIYGHDLDPCYIDLLAQFQVRANLVIPLIHGDHLWGLLCIHQCGSPRQWSPADVDLGQQLANQLVMAILQSDLVEQLQQELAERQQAQQQLTERNQQLAMANQDLSHATRLKDEFLANMSHELRTPLNVILGFAQILNTDASLQTQQRDYIRIMHRSGDHLLHLINDILDLSKIEANRITLEPESIDLFSLLYDLQAMFQERAEDRDLRFILALAPDLPQYIVVDPNKLRQVLINLLSNAVKFTDEGGVTLSVSLRQPLRVSASSSAPGGAELLFAVVDTGSGIAPAEIAAIFDAFTQAKVGRVALEGTGLGLTISRSLVRLMGGNLTVDSTQGQGSTFRVALPLCLARAEDVAPSGNAQPVIGLAPGQLTYRILVVDDQPENRYLMVAALSQIGLAVQEATQGAEAIARWRQWRPHLIWMDLRMLDIDGCEATRRIRAEAQEDDNDPGPVIIALTAQASHDERTRALAAGCDDFLSKPVQIDRVFTKMADHLGLHYRYAEPETPEPPSATPSTRLDAPALQVMPPDWIADLHRAALLCDSHNTAQLLQQIPPEHAALGDRLNRLLQDYKFEVIMQLTQPDP